MWLWFVPLVRQCLWVGCDSPARHSYPHRPPRWRQDDFSGLTEVYFALYLWLHLGYPFFRAALVAVLPSGFMAAARIRDQDHTLQQTIGGVLWGTCTAELLQHAGVYQSRETSRGRKKSKAQRPGGSPYFNTHSCDRCLFVLFCLVWFVCLVWFGLVWFGLFVCLFVRLFSKSFV